MAQRGKVLDEWTRRQIVRYRTQLSVRRTARHLDVSPTTVQKYRKKSRL